MTQQPVRQNPVSQQPVRQKPVKQNPVKRKPARPAKAGYTTGYELEREIAAAKPGYTTGSELEPEIAAAKSGYTRGSELEPEIAAAKSGYTRGSELEREIAAAKSGYTRGSELERESAAAKPLRIAGVDEVGRGAWAGPVVVCAAVVRAGFPEPPGGLTDSKRLTAKRRAELAAELPAWVEAYAIGAASHEEIDALGMTAALRLAARAALSQLAQRPDVVLLDGKHDYIGAPWPVRTAVKADLRSVSVAAASVLAKVHRDTLMAELGESCPGFAFADNAGYPAPVHQAALAEHGPTPYHRLSWAYLDDLPAWRHLKKQHRPAIDGQLSLL